MHVKTRGRQRTVAARTSRPGSDRSPARRGSAGGRRALGVLAAGLLAAACSASADTSTDVPDPTFARADGGSLAFQEPVANVSDLVGPAAEGDPWVIVGSMFHPETRAAQATVWTADDARGWEATTIPPDRRGTGETLAAASVTESGMIAVGQVGDGSDGDAAVWRLVDDEWEQSRPDEMAGQHEQWAFDVAVGEGGILVAGGENVWGEIRPRLWFSPDGETWETVDGGAGGPVDATGEEAVRDIAALGAGFVAVGSSTIDTEQDGAAWYSPDGTTWEQVEAPSLGGPGRQDVLTVSPAGSGVVAGGYAGDGNGQGQPVTWQSADGVVWSARSATLPVDDRRIAASDLAVRSISLASDGRTLIAAGGSEWRPHLWASTDGVAWRSLPDPVHGDMYRDGVALRDAVNDGTITVGLGAEPSVLLLDGTRWQDAAGDDFPTGGAQPFATSVALGAEGAMAAGGRHTSPAGPRRETYTGQLWRQDGDGWAEVDSDQLSAGHVMDTAGFAGGYVAVGFEDFGVAEGRDFAGDQEPDGLVWISTEGADWTRIGLANARINNEYLTYLDDPKPEHAAIIAQMEQESPPESAPPAGGAGTRSLAAVASIADGFVAVGSAYEAGDADPIIVVSSDGLSYRGETPVHTGPGIQQYNDVCVGPDNTAVAVGVAGATGAHDAIAAVRAERDAWTAGEGPFTGDGDQQAYGCAASEAGFIMVGSDDSSGNVDARVWTSADGIAWTELESGLLGGAGDQWASAVTAVPDGGGWLVAGTDTAAGDGDIALWRISTDGDVERRDKGEEALGGPGDQSVTDVEIDDDGRVSLAGNDYGRVGLWESDTLDR